MEPASAVIQTWHPQSDVMHISSGYGPSIVYCNA